MHWRSIYYIIITHNYSSVRLKINHAVCFRPIGLLIILNFQLFHIPLCYTTLKRRYRYLWPMHSVTNIFGITSYIWNTQIRHGDKNCLHRFLSIPPNTQYVTQSSQCLLRSHNYYIPIAIIGNTIFEHVSVKWLPRRFDNFSTHKYCGNILMKPSNWNYMHRGFEHYTIYNQWLGKQWNLLNARGNNTFS